MRYIWTIFFTLTLISLKSQDDFSLKVSLAPLALVDIIEGPNLKLGIESQYKRLGLCNEGGIYFSKYGQGLNTRNTLKYYFGYDLNYYIGIQYLYKDCIIPASKKIMVDSTKVSLSFKAHKIVNSLTINFGTTNTLFHYDDIYYDIFAGVGIRYSNNNQIGLTDFEAQAMDQTENHFIQSHYSFGKHYFPDVVIGLRLYFYAL
jgi:hypothetical protein